MRLIFSLILASFASQSWAFDFPVVAHDLTFIQHQSGMGARIPDIYVLANENFEIEFQCGRENVWPKTTSISLNCSLKITELASNQSRLYGISDFYQTGIEEFFRGFAVGMNLDAFYFGSLLFPNSLMLFHGNETRVYIPGGDENALFVEAQTSQPEKSSQR